MAGGRGTEKRAMAAQVLVRLPPLAAEAVERLAGEERLSKAAWLRGIVVRHVAELPSEEARPVQARRRPLPPEDVAAMSRMAAWLNRHNGALVQMTAALREGGHIFEHDRAEKALADLEVTAARLRKLSDRLVKDWEAAR